jgi:uncharacterized repeat protein (TIGR04138 family)
MHQPEILEIVRNDPRYAVEAYAFMFEALRHSQIMLDRVPPAGDRDPGDKYHVSGPELLRGACDLAREEFGLMAKVVFHQWGIHRTDDVGEIIFNLIESGILSKTEQDHRSDFQNVFDLDRALGEGFTISMNQSESIKRGTR